MSNPRAALFNAAINEERQSMGANKKTARLAGLLYLISVVTGVFSLMYVPSQTSGQGDTAAAVAHIINAEPLYRLGIAAGAVDYAIFLLLPLVLYKLLSSVNRSAAVTMVALALASVPLDFIALSTQLDILSLLDGAKYRGLLSSEQLQANAMLLLDSYHNRIAIAELFWGLWLFPFGYLVYKSGFLPRILGVLLMIGCFSYLITFFGQTLFPDLAIPGFVMLPVMFAELGTCMWLLIVGAREPLRGGGLA
ncbi:MAG: DUF4386 domain-containing protein [Pseudoxanthomonas sp.]